MTGNISSLVFRGTWRSYQARVLERADKYLSDGKIHIVAAPGSGKTTLGIELIGRLHQPALILAPSITIRQQWEDRIVEAFLADDIDPHELISQDLRNPTPITIATYQALHSAMMRYAGELKEENEEATDETQIGEQVDFSEFDLIKAMKEIGLGVLCLDECHHLRSEWWKALEEFKEKMGDLRTIALTATPPYDSTPALWTRYMNMCGDIDEEITVPELVKEGSLCPHQDYVYFNYPTKEEMKAVQQFEEQSELLMEEIMSDSQFATAVSGHKMLQGYMTEEEMLDEPSYLAAILIFLQSKQIAFPGRLQKLLGAKRLPEMDTKWMEILLQKLIYEDSDNFCCDTSYRETLQERLKQKGLIEKRKITLTTNTATEKLLISSKGKCVSILKIAEAEYTSLGNDLRMLILTDYIRKEFEKKIGSDEQVPPSLGVLPFFEMLRKQGNGPRLGVLCGSIVVIPAEAKEALLQVCGAEANVTFSKLGQLSEQDYVKVNVTGKAHFLTAAVTEIFKQGYIQIMIGTKSLLGEGWDSPCINSLILASFVGSFMLSNQMRGRAIRIMKEQPDKTSNIWHLVCLKPKKIKKLESKEGENSFDLSDDFILLGRRMEHFLGLHYEEDTIESGIQRLSIISPPFNRFQIDGINKKMLRMASQRHLLKERWKKALEIHNKMEVVEETEVPDKMITAAVFYDALRDTLVAVVTLIVWSIICISNNSASMLMAIGYCVILSIILSRFPKLIMLGTPYMRLRSIGNGILKAMREQNFLEDDRCKVKVETINGVLHAAYLDGGSGRDKALFAQCMAEFLGEVENQRYLLVRKRFRHGNNGFYCVPEVFAKKKEVAESFQRHMKSYIGKYDLVYTRSEAGRQILLEGRIHAFTNKRERCASKKKVKGALE